jgi:hypothetical protein
LEYLRAPDRSPEAPARAGRAAPTSGELLVRSSSRGMQRLRALVVCLSFAVCLPGTTRWELRWPARAVATPAWLWGMHQRGSGGRTEGEEGLHSWGAM